MAVLGRSAADELEAEVDLCDTVRDSSEWQSNSPAPPASTKFILSLIVLAFAS
jgi:hypothetical protein